MANVIKSAARVFIEHQYGGPTTEKESTPAVAALPNVSQMVPNNAERVALIFSNISSQVFNIGTNPQILGTVGGIFMASGANISMNVRDDATLPTLAWYAEATNPGSFMYVLEVIRSIYTPPDEVEGITTS